MTLSKLRFAKMLVEFLLLMYAMAKIMKMAQEQENQVALFLFNNIKLR